MHVTSSLQPEQNHYAGRHTMHNLRKQVLHRPLSRAAEFYGPVRSIIYDSAQKKQNYISARTYDAATLHNNKNDDNGK